MAEMFFIAVSSSNQGRVRTIIIINLLIPPKKAFQVLSTIIKVKY